MSKEAMKLALEALENTRSLEPVDVQWVKGKRHAAITALREALAEQPAQQEFVQNNPFDCGVYLGSGKDYAIKHHVSYGPAQQEPLTWLKVIETPGGWGKFVEAKPHEKGAKPVYTAPQPAQRNPLTDAQIKDAVRGAGLSFTAPDFKVARAIEAKLKENT